MIRPNCPEDWLELGLLEVHVVEQVEELGAELQAHALPDLCPLRGAEIHVEEARPAQDVLA